MGLTLPASVRAFLLGDGPDIAMDSLDIATVVLDIASSIVPRTTEKSYSVIRRRQMDVFGKRVRTRSSRRILFVFPFPGSRMLLHLGRL